MTTTSLAHRTPAPSAPRRERRSDAERKLARRLRLVHRGLVASYLHDISQRHAPAGAAA